MRKWETVETNIEHFGLNSKLNIRRKVSSFLCLISTTFTVRRGGAASAVGLVLTPGTMGPVRVERKLETQLNLDPSFHLCFLFSPFFLGLAVYFKSFNLHLMKYILL